MTSDTSEQRAHSEWCRSREGRNYMCNCLASSSTSPKVSDTSNTGTTPKRSAPSAVAPPAEGGPAQRENTPHSSKDMSCPACGTHHEGQCMSYPGIIKPLPPKDVSTHDITCNYRRGPLFADGCICKVVNKHEWRLTQDEIERLTALQAAHEGANLAEERNRLRAALEQIAEQLHPERWHNIGCGLEAQKIARETLAGSAAETDTVCEAHPDKPWPHDDCIGPGMLPAEPGAQMGQCCYGGTKPKSACASCAAWAPI